MVANISFSVSSRSSSYLDSWKMTNCWCTFLNDLRNLKISVFSVGTCGISLVINLDSSTFHFRREYFEAFHIDSKIEVDLCSPFLHSVMSWPDIFNFLSSSSCFITIGLYSSYSLCICLYLYETDTWSQLRACLDT